MSVSREVAAYLRGLAGCTNIRPATVVIGREVFNGAYYEQPQETGADRRRFYLIGETPEVFRKAGRDRHGESKVIFTFDGREWYAAGGYTPFLCKPWGKADFVNTFTGADMRPFHPFGHWFDLSEWPTESHGKIDQWADKPRKRVPMSVHFLPESDD